MPEKALHAVYWIPSKCRENFCSLCIICMESAQKAILKSINLRKPRYIPIRVIIISKIWMVHQTFLYQASYSYTVC